MHSKILELLEKLNHTIHSSVNSSFSRIEIDIMQQQLRTLYEELDALKRTPKIDMPNPPIAEPSLLHNSMILPVEKKEVTKVVAATEQPIIVEVEKIAPTVIVEAKLIEQEVQLVAKVETVETIKVETVTTTAVNVNTRSISEKFETVESLNERLKSSTHEVHTKLAVKPLKELIDLNKRFVLVNELFKGDSSVFTQTIQQIDGFTDYASANTFILAQNFDWDQNSQAFRLFKKLVKQKFGEE